MLLLAWVTRHVCECRWSMYDGSWDFSIGELRRFFILSTTKGIFCGQDWGYWGRAISTSGAGEKALVALRMISFSCTIIIQDGQPLWEAYAWERVLLVCSPWFMVYIYPMRCNLCLFCFFLCRKMRQPQIQVQGKCRLQPTPLARYFLEGQKPLSFLPPWLYPSILTTWLKWLCTVTTSRGPKRFKIWSTSSI